MVTPAQLDANRANALKSTGPRSAEGKDASRRNALKHGLAAESLILPEEEADAVAARVAAWTPSLRPRDDFERWLVEEMAVTSLRMTRCRDHETALRTRSAARAATSWDEDRDAEVEALAGGLNRAPSIVAAKLRRTKQGCSWLYARWIGLAGALDAPGGWNDAQKKLALDLLGTPKEFRDGPNALDGDLKALVARQVSLLREHLHALEGLDELERTAAEVGLGDEEKAITLARRYETAAFRRFERAQKQLGKGRPAGWMRPTSQPSAPATPAPPQGAGNLAKVTTVAAPAPVEVEVTVAPVIPAPAPPAPAAPAKESRRARRARLAKLRKGR